MEGKAEDEFRGTCLVFGRFHCLSVGFSVKHKGRLSAEGRGPVGREQEGRIRPGELKLKITIECGSIAHLCPVLTRNVLPSI